MPKIWTEVEWEDIHCCVEDEPKRVYGCAAASSYCQIEKVIRTPSTLFSVFESMEQCAQRKSTDISLVFFEIDVELARQSSIILFREFMKVGSWVLAQNGVDVHTGLPLTLPACCFKVLDQQV